MKTNWPIKKLREVADLQNGYAFKSGDYIKYSNTLNFRMSNIRPDGTVNINYNAKYLPNSYAEKYKEFLLKDGDIVIAMTDMANDPKILGLPTIIKTEGKDLLLNQRVGKFININERAIFIPFLRYYLSTNEIKNYYKSLGGGGLQINISKQNILSVKIPLPGIEEQKRIIKKLEKILAKIYEAKKLMRSQLEGIEDLQASVLNKAFTGDLQIGGVKEMKKCPKCNSEMVKIKKSPVVNLANLRSKLPESSDWWVCNNCDHEEKA